MAATLRVVTVEAAAADVTHSTAAFARLAAAVARAETSSLHYRSHGSHQPVWGFD